MCHVCKNLQSHLYTYPQEKTVVSESCDLKTNYYKKMVLMHYDWKPINKNVQLNILFEYSVTI